jgi:catechol 2,3-dioxygenase-like lactoylglutathione lyase family enzyme
MKWHLEHMGLAARDTTALARWYQEKLQFRLICKTDEEPPAYFLEEPGGMIIEIVPGCGEDSLPTRRDAGWRHAAMIVEDFDDTYQALKDAGVNIEPPFVNGTNHVAFLRDLEGNLLHLIERGEPLEKGK